MNNSNDPIIREQSKAIGSETETRPAPAKETPREARWRVQREAAEREAKKNPHKGY